MVNVIQLPSAKVTVSDLARSLLEMETERVALDSESASLMRDQHRILMKAQEEISYISKKQEALIEKRALLDDAILGLLSQRAAQEI